MLKRKPFSLVALLLVIASAVITVGILGALIIYIVVKGVPNINADLFAWEYTTENVSMMPAIINTVLMTGLALLIAVPVGVCSAKVIPRKLEELDLAYPL